jgi:hypothetical protein
MPANGRNIDDCGVISCRAGKVRETAISSSSGTSGRAPPQPPFIDTLPSPLARDCLAAWRSARHGETLPALWDFAPHGLPPAVLPWLLIHRQRRDGELVYGLAGDELIHWMGENPKGKPVLGTSDPQVRAQRIALVRQSLATGMPFWFRGMLLLDNQKQLAVGRLCLPARDNDEHVLLVIYFILGDRPPQRLNIVNGIDGEAAQTLWCEPSDLAD